MEQPRVETMEYAAMMRRMLGGWERRLRDADLEDVAELVNFTSELNAAIERTVGAMREAGRSWAEIARVFGTSRQNVQQRWAHLA